MCMQAINGGTPTYLGIPVPLSLSTLLAIVRPADLLYEPTVSFSREVSQSACSWTAHAHTAGMMSVVKGMWHASTLKLLM